MLTCPLACLLVPAAVALWCVQPPRQRHWRWRRSSDCGGAEEQQHTAAPRVSAALNGLHVCVCVCVCVAMCFDGVEESEETVEIVQTSL